MPRFAANLTMMFNEVDFLARFAAARALGFTAVEYLFPYSHAKSDLAVRLKDEGLQQVLFNAPPGDWEKGERGMAALPGRQAEFRATIETALEYAAALKCPRIHVMAGLLPRDTDPAACRAVMAENLIWAAALAKKSAVTLMLEPLNPTDFPGYVVGNVAVALEIIKAVGADNVRLQYDLYHAQMMQGRLAQTLQDNLALIDHIQIAGVPGRHEPDARQEINYPYLFDLMDQLGYAGWVGCEYRPSGNTVVELAWAEKWGIGV
jgi:hydroxypyruvate isomerase